jgi:sulfate transport system substrate-binding protein
VNGALVVVGMLGWVAAEAADSLLNVSYDATRALYAELNAAWGQATVRQSHGGSAKQARLVAEGLPADVVTLALPLDVELLVAAGRVGADWRTRLPHQAAPFTSTVVFLVRAGNPKGIRDWSDLGRDDVVPILANPKTSGAARLAYLAAWHSQPDDTEAWMAAWLRRVPTFDAGARGAAATFVRRGLGDVLLTWESEAWLAAQESQGAAEVVVPPASILAEPPVAWVDAIVAHDGSRALAEAYLRFLYTPPAQAIAARHHFRPRDPGAAAGFPALRLVTVEASFGSWAAAQAAHFADGGTFDRLSVR